MQRIYHKTMCITEIQHNELTVSHLHNAIPVVPGGYTEQQEESHAKILERGITAKTFTGVQLITYWREKIKCHR